MKSLQKRYIYSSLVAALFFILLYLVFDFPLIYCLILMICIYIGGIFLFKEKDIRGYNADDINYYYFQTSKILNYKNRIKNKNIVDDILTICNISEKILSALAQKPKKVTQVYNFFDYYLNLVNNLLNKYVYVIAKNEQSISERKLIDKMENYLENIKEQFVKQLDNMYKVQELDMASEIKMFEKICKIEGLDKEADNNE